MTPSKNDIKAWLKQIGQNRKWLAAQLGISLGSVNNYLSNNEQIPDRVYRLISFLMANSKEPDYFKITIPNDYIDFVKTESEKRGISIDDYCAQLITNVLTSTVSLNKH